MMYTVELNFSDAPRADEWNAWYETYLQKLVTLPGLSTAQRFRAVEKDAQHWEYLALYSIASLDVYESDAYRAIGGGGNASAAYKEAITRRRNVYAGVERMPEVTANARVVLCEDAPYGVDLPNLLFTPLAVATGPAAGGRLAHRRHAGAPVDRGDGRRDRRDAGPRPARRARGLRAGDEALRGERLSAAERQPLPPAGRCGNASRNHLAKCRSIVQCMNKSCRTVTECTLVSLRIVATLTETKRR